MKRTLLSISLLLSGAVAMAQPTNGLISEYNFNDGTANDAVGGANGTLMGGAALTTDRFGNLAAISLDGVDEYIYVANPAHDFSTTTTVSMWVLMDQNAANNNHQLFDTRGYDFGATSQVAWIDRANGQVEMGAPGGIKQYDKVLAGELWYHFVIAIDPVNDVRTLHVNGVEVTDIASAPAFVDPVYDGDTLIFGVRSDFVPSTHFHGKMDDIKIYDRVLTSGEITQLFNDQSYAGVVPSGLVSRYTFTGNANDDISGANGTANGTTLTWDRFGNPFGSYYFDGSSDYINVASPVHNFANNTTISLWVKRANVGSIFFNQHLFDTRDGSFLSEGAPVGWIDTQTDRVEFGVPGGGIIQYAAEIIPEQWYHLVIIYDVAANQKLLYLNGILVTDIPSAGNYIDPIYTNQPMTFGARADLDPTGLFNGSMDDIRIYNRALNAGEVTELYHEGGYMIITDVANSEKSDTEITAYPNPTNGVLNFGNLDLSEVQNINVFGTTGQVLKTFNTPTSNISIANLPNGLYLLTIEKTDGTRSIVRVAKN